MATVKKRERKRGESCEEENAIRMIKVKQKLNKYEDNYNNNGENEKRFLLVYPHT
jgi:hypothetical protein